MKKIIFFVLCLVFLAACSEQAAEYKIEYKKEGERVYRVLTKGPRCEGTVIMGPEIKKVDHGYSTVIAFAVQDRKGDIREVEIPFSEGETAPLRILKMPQKGDELWVYEKISGCQHVRVLSSSSKGLKEEGEKFF